MRHSPNGPSGTATECAGIARRYGEASLLGPQVTLTGPVGERNLYTLHPRGRILLVPAKRAGLYEQMAAVLATGNTGDVRGMDLPAGLPAHVADSFNPAVAQPFAAALVEGDAARVASVLAAVAERPGAIVPVYAARRDRSLAYETDWLVEEVAISINTTAAGGNASLMMLGDSVIRSSSQ